MKRIRVTGVGGSASQNFIASLRMAPEPFYIVGTDTNPYHLACADVEARYVLPRCDEPGYLQTLLSLLASENIELLHPQPDVEVAFLSAHREEIPVRLKLPSRRAVELCHDKAACNAAMAQRGVPVPAGYRVEALDALPELFHTLQQAGEKVWLRAIRGAGSRAALPVTSVRQAREWIHYWEAGRGLTPQDFMLSTFLPGREFAFQSVWHQGRLVTSMARERMEYLFGNLMPSGQSSSPSIARTVHRADVNEAGTRAVQSVDSVPDGVYCVDMKEDADGRPSVTEINPGRFFTTSNFFSEAGSNMPYYYVRLAFGERLPALPAYNPLEADLYWVRGVDRTPTLLRGEAWIAKSAA